MTNTPCKWYGIICKNGGVTHINLGGSTAPIIDKSYFPNKKFGNKLNGTLPNFRGLLHLQKLDVRHNQLTGAIPDFSALPNLEVLDLDGNQLCKNTNINYSSWQETQINRFPNRFPNCPKPATVKMQLNESRYTTSNSLRLDMQVNGEAKADLYVAIVFPDGDFMTIAYPLAFSQINAIQIYQPAVEIVGQKTFYPIVDFSLPAGITTGGYHACGVLVLAGAKPTLEPNNWIHSHCAGFEVY